MSDPAKPRITAFHHPRIAIVNTYDDVCYRLEDPVMQVGEAFSSRLTGTENPHQTTMSDENETKVSADSAPKRSQVEMWLRFAAVLGGCATFAWTAFTYFADRRSSNEAEKIKASQPFLDRQLKLFENATETAAFIATSSDSQERNGKIQVFWQLYWGRLSMVEKGEVEGAMVRFGDDLNAKAELPVLQQDALQIAYACRDELARSWKIHDWLKEDHSPKSGP
jgi:hypothetical protein